MTNELNGAVGCDPVFFQSRRAAYGYFAFGYPHSSHQELSNGPGASDRLAQWHFDSLSVRLVFQLQGGHIRELKCEMRATPW